MELEQNVEKKKTVTNADTRPKREGRVKRILLCAGGIARRAMVRADGRKSV